MMESAPIDYESEQYGPLKLERLGRYVRLSSDWEPGEFEKHIENVKAHQEPFKQEINEKIRELITIVEQYDPLELLSTVAVRNVFADAETFSEATHKGKEAYIEYALSLALSVKNPNLGIHATKEAIERFNALIDEIFNSMPWYFAVGGLEESNETKRELRFKSLLSFLMLRGDSYPVHHIDLVKGLFETHNDFFSENYGFNVSQVISWVGEIESQSLKAFNRYGEFSAKMHEMYQNFMRFTEEQRVDPSLSMEECIAIYDSLPEIQSKRKELEGLHEKLDYFIFELKVGEKLPQSFLDLLSSKFGENEAFVLFEKAPGWPTNDSIISRRAILSHNGKYYCFGIQIIYRKLIQILEALIKEKDAIYFETTYQSTRGDYLVRKALEHFRNLLPGATIFDELYYETNIDGERVRAETDGIIVFDTNLIIVEGKAGAFSIPARRGALPRLKHDVTELVDKAYGQALRAMRYINETDKPEFEHQNGTKALVFDDKSIFKNIFLVNVTLENLGYLATQLNSLKELEIINDKEDKEWPWSVFLNDLRVISEIIETPSEFLVYLKRRLRANDYPRFRTSDELDFLMYYLREGLYFEESPLGVEEIVSPYAYTEDLDRYYHYQEGIVSSGEKPRLKIPEEYKTFIRKIEATGQESFSEVTTTLLDFSVETMEDILSNTRRIKQASLSDGRNHDFTLIFSPLSLGITISTLTNGKNERFKTVNDYCALKMYQLKHKKWVFLAIDNADGEDIYKFKLFDKEWRYDAQMEESLKQYRRQKIDQFLASSNKIGRNDLCPCNSGQKYKKCCGSS